MDCDSVSDSDIKRCKWRRVAAHESQIVGKVWKFLKAHIGVAGAEEGSVYKAMHYLEDERKGPEIKGSVGV